MVMLWDELPEPTRLPLHWRTIGHIAGQCGTSAARQKLLRREIEIIRQNVAARKLSMWMAGCYMDAIRELI